MFSFFKHLVQKLLRKFAARPKLWLLGGQGLLCCKDQKWIQHPNDSKLQRLQRRMLNPRTEPEFVFKCCQEKTEDKYDEKLHGKPNVRTPAIYVIPGTVETTWTTTLLCLGVEGWILDQALDENPNVVPAQQNSKTWRVDLFIYIFLEGRNHRKRDLWLTVSIANKQSFCIMIFVHSNCLINESGSLTWCGFTSTPPFTFSLLWAFTFSRMAWRSVAWLLSSLEF